MRQRKIRNQKYQLSEKEKALIEFLDLDLRNVGPKSKKKKSLVCCHRQPYGVILISEGDIFGTV